MIPMQCSEPTAVSKQACLVAGTEPKQAALSSIPRKSPAWGPRMTPARLEQADLNAASAA